MIRSQKTPAVAAALALLVGLGLGAPAEAQRAEGSTTFSSRAEAYSTADIQRALSRAGYDPGPVDGIMGQGTRSAIAAFQRDHGLAATGTPTSAFYRALERQGYLTARTEPTPAGPDSDAASIAEMERRLSAAGYDPGPVDGRMDWQTRSALRAFQRDADLQVTGRIDPTTRAVLRARTSGALAEAPATPAEPTLNPALVEDVQLALQRRGYEDVAITGALDVATRAAIRDVQRREGLPVTGRPTRDLLSRLEVAGRPESLTATADPRGALVEQVETALANKGYAVGPINRTVEPETAEAIRTYQGQRGMLPTGEVSETLLADLRASDVQAPPEQPQQAQDPASQLFRLLGERALQELQGQ